MNIPFPHFCNSAEFPFSRKIVGNIKRPRVKDFHTFNIIILTIRSAHVIIRQCLLVDIFFTVCCEVILDYRIKHGSCKILAVLTADRERHNIVCREISIFFTGFQKSLFLTSSSGGIISVTLHFDRIASAPIFKLRSSKTLVITAAE